MLQRVATASLTFCTLVLSAFIDPALAQTGMRAQPLHRSAQVYILRGFMNMSPGLDEIAEKVEKHRIQVSVANYVSWPGFAQDAIQRYKSGKLRSIVIIGHSMGGGAAVDMATELANAGVPVSLLVTFDLVGTSTTPRNVRRVVNYQVNGGVGVAVQGSAKSQGVIRNIVESAPEVGHFSIIALRQRQLINHVLAAVR